MARKEVTLKKGIVLHTGTNIPKGTKLRVGKENTAYFAGEEVDMDAIPDEALENQGSVLDQDIAQAMEEIDQLADKACEGDDDALVKITEIAKETAQELAQMAQDQKTQKKAMEDGFGDLDQDQLQALQESAQEVLEKLDQAAESGDQGEIEDAVEQFRSIMGSNQSSK